MQLKYVIFAMAGLLSGCINTPRPNPTMLQPAEDRNIYKSNNLSVDSVVPVGLDKTSLEASSNYPTQSPSLSNCIDLGDLISRGSKFPIESVASDIDDNGRIVGSYVFTVDGRANHSFAFIYDGKTCTKLEGMTRAKMIYSSPLSSNGFIAVGSREGQVGNEMKRFDNEGTGVIYKDGKSEDVGFEAYPALRISGLGYSDNGRQRIIVGQQLGKKVEVPASAGEPVAIFKVGFLYAQNASPEWYIPALKEVKFGGVLSARKVVETDVASFAQGSRAFLLAVNALVMAQDNRGNPGASFDHAFIVTRGNGNDPERWQDLTTSTKRSNAKITSINDSGQAVGYSSNLRTESVQDAYGYLFDGSHVVDIPGLSSGGHVMPRYVNAAGDVVGSAMTADNKEHAFLYHKGKTIDLNVYAAKSGLELSVAASINNIGQICGTAKKSGKNHAFLLRLPSDAYSK